MHALVNTFYQRNLQQPKNPFQPTTCVVQSFGMGQWLKLELARRGGIAANIECLLPADMIWQLYRCILPVNQLPAESPFSTKFLTWHLMSLLPECREEEFRNLQDYLGGSGDPQLRLYQLSASLAGLFDKYLVYRPDWITAWESGNQIEVQSTDQKWQGMLWRRLLELPGVDRDQHRTHVHSSFLDRLSGLTSAPQPLPESINILGLSSMPEMHMQTLQAIARLTNVDIYFLNPCEHYWGDIISEKQQAKLSIRSLLKATGPLVDEDYLEIGNPLLSSMGKQGREYLELLLSTEEMASQEHFESFNGNSTLNLVKNDILNLVDGGHHSDDSMDENVSGATLKIPRADRSIQMHSCHSRMREIEILRDQLLAMIDAEQKEGRNISLSDIIVMAPDINQYAPFIQAVFEGKLHFSITDRTIKQESATLAAFEKLLALPESRLSASAVMDFLEVPAIADKFDLDETDLSTLFHWIRESGIRWEVDGQSKSTHWGLPASDHNTWVFGLKRLLLGYAMQVDQSTVFKEIAPLEVNPSDSHLIGTLSRIIELLDSYRTRLGQSHLANEWLSVISDLMADFFSAEGEDELTLDSIRASLAELVEQTEKTDFGTPISPRVFRHWLDKQLSAGGKTRGFVGGGITFATLVPMRSIPFEIVCLIGMTDKEFPREDKTPGFDLMSVEWRKGDRSKRNDDRYLFLEALISAGRYFYISFEGRSQKDNKVKPSSVLVSELSDYLQRIYKKTFITNHPLQPFSPDYFLDQHPDLVSYQENWYQARKNEIQAARFVDIEIPEIRDNKLTELGQLTDFFRHPAKYYLRHLGVYFEDNDDELEDTEPFDLDPLQRYKLADSALTAMIHGIPPETWQSQQRAMGTVMEGIPGENQLAREFEKANNVYDELRSCLSDKNSLKPSAISGKLTLGNDLLYGEVMGFENRYIDFRTGRQGKRHLLEAWVNHLFLNALGYDAATPLISTNKDKIVRQVLNPLSKEDAATHIEALVELYYRGLSEPLPFLPETSWSLFENMRKGEKLETAMEKAIQTYVPDEYTRAEGGDINNYRLFVFPDDLTQEFIDTAETIYSPLFENWEDLD